MASLVWNRGKWWARVKGLKSPGKWSLAVTQYKQHERDKAQRFAQALQDDIDRKAKGETSQADPRGTVTAYVLGLWIEERKRTGHDWKKDKARLEAYVLPRIGDLKLRDVRAQHIAALVKHLRFTAKTNKGEPLAPRYVRNIYSVVSAMFHDAAIEGLIDNTPCILTVKQLGHVEDKDREWRMGALYTRQEAEAMISDPRIPIDRQAVYAFGLLAGLRPGEVGALRWRSWDATETPLSRLTVALSYSTKASATKSTKTRATKTIPVHPTLAAMLAELRQRWSSLFGHEPGPDDLIVPLPPDVMRTKRKGERFRGYDYSGRRWREIDLPALGLRKRSIYDTKSTFITLAIEDGADATVIRDRVTHTKPRRNAFDGYDRGTHWEQTCREVAKLRVTRHVTTSAVTDEKRSSGGGFRTFARGSKAAASASVLDGRLRSRCDLMRALLVTCVSPPRRTRGFSVRITGDQDDAGQR